MWVTSWNGLKNGDLNYNSEKCSYMKFPLITVIMYTITLVIIRFFTTGGMFANIEFLLNIIFYCSFPWSSSIVIIAIMGFP